MLPIYIITGCTAGGKSSLAYELARRISGQILSVDSMKIYRHMDIGTAKPPAERLEGVVHHAVDVADPWAGSENFTVNDFSELADGVIADCRSKNIPIIACGGTNLYLKVLTEGIFDGPGGDAELRAALGARADAEGLEKLHAELAEVDEISAGRIHPNDRRRIIRALEVYKLTGKAISALQSQWDSGQKRYDYRMIILTREKEDCNGRINARVKKMVEMGLIEEAQKLWEDSRKLNRQAAAAVGYAEFFEFFKGNCSRDEAIERVKINTRRFGKNQRTWLRRFVEAKRLNLSCDSTVETAIEEASGLLELDI